uniref:UFSP1/2/DUB catalytic domain-containing protein n=1 Tax=Cladonia uncialis subsp. uncialis TaxID=180999 RepID=A0A1Z1C536_CLAUC|nr:hypothetical protein [Cladonia uncialis subsp. uncialis]AUW30984.1 hypothetical protein [Cladonia uncialis subsp. uncialis]
MAPGKRFECPFCTFTHSDDYLLLHHVETSHPETDRPSPFTVSESANGRQEDGGSSDESEGAKDGVPEYIECQCGEFCLLAEFESHLDMHYAEGTSFDETRRTSADLAVPGSTLYHGRAKSPAMESPPPAPVKDVVSASSKSMTIRTKPKDPSRARSGKSHNVVQDFIDVLRHSTVPPPKKVTKQISSKEPQRLGKAELGPHADEERMPEWLRRQLEHGAKITIVNNIGPDGRLIRTETIANEYRNIIPVLAQLCDQDPSVSRVYFCNPNVTHVVKMAKEGGFCGYRNIQMMISYIRDARSEGYRLFHGRLPSVIQLQDMIEDAWERGFNSMGKVETGGIRGTRKYIGTPEAQALLQSLNIGCKAEAYNDDKELPVQHQLLRAVEQYFLDSHPNPNHKVCRTSLPPMYFQHPGK